MVSHYSKADFALSADPSTAQWKKIPPVIMENDAHGKPVPGHRTEVRSRWTDKYLYVLYTCPYEELYLHPNPTQTEETNELWNWDVAEIFIGTNKEIRRYTEYELSPQGEWVDLDILRDKQPPEHDWKWNSGFKVKSRIDHARKIWYGEMQIPFAALGIEKPAKGTTMRVNLYRVQGPPPRKDLAWRPTNSNSFHVPESFGRLTLE